MKRLRNALLIAAALAAATAAPVRAQLMKDDKPSLRRSEEARKNDADIDQQFRTRRDSNTAPANKDDPWAGVRSGNTPPATADKKPAPKTSAKN